MKHLLPVTCSGSLPHYDSAFSFFVGGAYELSNFPYFLNLNSQSIFFFFFDKTFSVRNIEEVRCYSSLTHSYNSWNWSIEEGNEAGNEMSRESWRDFCLKMQQHGRKLWFGRVLSPSDNVVRTKLLLIFCLKMTLGIVFSFFFFFKYTYIFIFTYFEKHVLCTGTVLGYHLKKSD